MRRNGNSGKQSVLLLSHICHFHCHGILTCLYCTLLFQLASFKSGVDRLKVGLESETKKLADEKKALETENEVLVSINNNNCSSLGTLGEFIHFNIPCRLLEME